MVFCKYAHFFSDFLHFDKSLLLLTVTLRGVSNKHCLLSLFSFLLILFVYFLYLHMINADLLWILHFSGIIPVSYMKRHLGDKNLRMRHHYLGGSATKPVALALRV